MTSRVVYTAEWSDDVRDDASYYSRRFWTEESARRLARDKSRFAEFGGLAYAVEWRESDEADRPPRERVRQWVYCLGELETYEGPETPGL